MSKSADTRAHEIGCDAHFFAIALASTLYWLGKCDLQRVSYASQIQEYLTKLSAGKDIRDMLEHDGEYIIGGGRKQSDYQITKKVNNGKLEIQGLAPFTLVNSDEGLSLGGRISIEEAHRLSVDLLKAISEQPGPTNPASLGG